MSILTYNKENLIAFKRVIREVHKNNSVSSFAVPLTDQAKCEEVLRMVDKGKRDTRKDAILWRMFRQRVAQLFKRDHNIRGTFEWQIDWSAAYDWIVKNWTTILRILVVLIGVVV